MRYGITQDNRFLFIDDNKQRLLDTLAFLPDYTESDIHEYQEDEIEQAYTSEWYVKGHAPTKPAPTKDEVRAIRQELYQTEADPLRYDMDEAFSREETEKGEQCRGLWLAKKDEIRANNPYPVEVSDDQTPN